MTNKFQPDANDDKYAAWAEEFWDASWTFQIDDTYTGHAKYHMSGQGNSVKSMTFGYPKTHQITIEINAASNGQLAIKLPNNYVADYPYYDTKQHYAYVFLDDTEVKPMTGTEFCNEIYYIPFQKGAKTIEILGDSLAAQVPISGKGHRVNGSILATGSQTFDLPMVTNSDTCDLDFKKTERLLEISLSRPLVGEGYFQITIPKAFMSGNFTLLLDGEKAEFNATDSTTSADLTIIAFNYPYGTNTATIMATYVIPEFGPVIIGSVVAAMITITLLIPRIVGRR